MGSRSRYRAQTRGYLSFLAAFFSLRRGGAPSRPPRAPLPISELLKQQVDRAELLPHDAANEVGQRLGGRESSRRRLRDRLRDGRLSSFVHIALLPAGIWARRDSVLIEPNS